MKPYVDLNGERLYLSSIIDANRFEVCIHPLNGSQYHFLLCPIVKKRYVQATGAVLEREGNELRLAVQGRKLVRRTFPLEGMESLRIQAERSIPAPAESQEMQVESENQ